MSQESGQAAAKRSNTLRLVIVLGIALVLIGVGALVVLLTAGGSGEASEVISAPTLPPGENVFSIVSSASEVRFSLDEVLVGRPTHVVGKTNEIAGDLRVDFSNPAASEVGTIRINMRTLQTDNEFRNRAIRGMILQSAQDEFEFAEFVPSRLEGLPESVTICQPFTFQVIGALTVRHITQEITFTTTVTPVSAAWIEGHAESTVTRTQFELEIPRAPGVADVTDEVLLEIDFVATPGGTVDATPEVGCSTTNPPL